MNKNISEEKIEIDGKEYTLFINRTGLVAWEKHTKFAEYANLLKKRYDGIMLDEDNQVEITEDTNPFTMYGDLENLDEDEEKLREATIEFYWVALYTHHKLNINQVRELFKKAEYGTDKEAGYGLDQLVQLVIQMVNSMNTDNVSTNKIKNLKALRPTK